MVDGMESCKYMFDTRQGRLYVHDEPVLPDEAAALCASQSARLAPAGIAGELISLLAPCRDGRGATVARNASAWIVEGDGCRVRRGGGDLLGCDQRSSFLCLGSPDAGSSDHVTALLIALVTLASALLILLMAEIALRMRPTFARGARGCFRRDRRRSERGEEEKKSLESLEMKRTKSDDSAQVIDNVIYESGGELLYEEPLSPTAKITDEARFLPPPMTREVYEELENVYEVI